MPLFEVAKNTRLSYKLQDIKESDKSYSPSLSGHHGHNPERPMLVD